MRVFITGVAGFIGFHLARRMLAEGHEVLGYDGVTPYYDVSLKRRRLGLLESGNCQFRFVEAMLEDREALEAAAADFAPQVIIHLAAQAGVRYSLEQPRTYVDANLVGTFNLLEVARQVAPEHLLFASTSSVYGGNQQMPFREIDRADFPVSLYAATKKAGEAMSHSHAHLFGIPTTCFRFFTVYGPWGRPDMALFKFVSAMLGDRPIEVYGEGRMRRDFTYVDDLVDAILRLIPQVPQAGRPVGDVDSISAVAPWRSVNIAGGQPVELMAFIAAIEKSLRRTALKRMLPMQPGDVVATWADPSLLKMLTGDIPQTSVEEGVANFVAWFQDEFREPVAM